MYLRKTLITIFFIAVSLFEAVAQSAFAPFPKAANPYWRTDVPKSMCQDYIRLGNQYSGKTWDKIPDEVFAQFRTTGNRTNYEDSCFARRCQFACLVMAEVMEYKGRFIKDICNGLHYFIDKEPWWGLPAHYPEAKPDSTIQPVDLFNAETSSMLAWTLYMLSAEIDRAESGLSERISHEIDRRFLTPTLTEKHGWMRSVNNWNTWIMSNFIETCLICYPSDSKHLAKALKINESCMRLFLNGYPNDGGCEEGVGYWDRAGASFFESLWMLRAAEPIIKDADNRMLLTSAELQKVAAMGRFITTMHIGNLSFVNFSDAKVQNVPNINILFPYGEWLKDSCTLASTDTLMMHKWQDVGTQMMQFAAYIANKYNYYVKPSTLFLQSGNWPTLGRELMLLSMLKHLSHTPVMQPKTLDAWLANSQIMVASNDSWLIAAKGGNNAESHNHNDVGSFVIYRNGKPVVIDLGRDTYTSQTFGPHRYEMTNNRSLYHNVPVVNGYEQKDGRQYEGINVDHTYTDSASIMLVDIAKAYPVEAGVRSWVRRLTLDRMHNRIEITEHIIMNDNNEKSGSGNVQQAKANSLQNDSISTDITLMCYGSPRSMQQGRVALADGKTVLVYNPKTVDVSWSKLQMNDGIMKTQWQDNVYRLVMKSRLKSGIIRYWFE